MDNPVLLIALISSAVRLAVPIAFAALGGLISERAGFINIALEGFMTIGAFAAFVGALFLGNAWLGILTGILGAILVSLLFTVLTIKLRANQIIVGMAINILALGMVSFLFRILGAQMGVKIEAASFYPYPIPVLSQIPWLGPTLFNHTPLVYLAFIAIPVTAWFLFKTHWGLELRSVGENPLAAETAGINVHRMRFQALLVCGIFTGIAGAALSIGQMSTFNEFLVNGRGYIALAAVIFGRWHPFGTTIAALLFGLCDALQLRMQVIGIGISNQLLLMFPYLATFLAFILFIKNADAPAAGGKPYPED